jgi:hypothetical protein
MRERKTSSMICCLAQVGNRFLNIADSMDQEAVNGDKESMMDAATPAGNAGDGSSLSRHGGRDDPEWRWR